MKKNFSHLPEILAVLVALGLLHLLLLIFLVCQDAGIEPGKAGSVGSFINGYLGTMFLIISVGLLAATFRNQKWTNEQTIFESRFFELLKFHRDNVAEIEIANKTGRRAFVSLIREFRATLKIVGDECGPAYLQAKKIDLAYMAFYYGVGPNSTRVLTDAVQNHPKEMVQRVVEKLEELQNQCREFDREKSYAEKNRTTPIGITTRPTPELFERLSYVPFDGHQSRLAHYFRHLYHTVKYAVNHSPEGKAHEYIDIVRAQLTNHEQALLCVNALSTIGSAWLERKYLTNYSLIKNIPESFFDRGKEIDLKALFPSIRFEFEDKGESPTDAK